MHTKLDQQINQQIFLHVFGIFFAKKMINFNFLCSEIEQLLRTGNIGW